MSPTFVFINTSLIPFIFLAFSIPSIDSIIPVPGKNAFSTETLFHFGFKSLGGFPKAISIAFLIKLTPLDKG